jgi:hypothetical protein
MTTPDTSPKAASRTCRLGFHHWVLTVNDMDERCFTCSACGRVDPDNDSHLAAYAAAFGFGGRQPLPHWWSDPRHAEPERPRVDRRDESRGGG